MYVCQSWGQSFNTLNKMQALQDTAALIIVFRTNNDNVGELLRVCWRELFICKRCNKKFVTLPPPPPPLSKTILLNHKIYINITLDITTKTLS